MKEKQQEPMKRIVRITVGGGRILYSTPNTIRTNRDL